MKILNAVYKINQYPYLYVQCDPKLGIELNTIIDEYKVVIKSESLSESGFKRDRDEAFTHVVHSLKLQVSKKENELPPNPHTSDDTWDYSLQKDYFQKRIPGYNSAATLALNRLIAYFKFKLRNPKLSFYSDRDPQLLNPEWVDENNQKIGKGSLTLVVEAAPGYGTSNFGVQALKADDDKIYKFMNKDYDSPLWEQLLMEAQLALFDNNLRRGIFEMTLACEVFVRESFFGDSVISRLLFEYLEDKSEFRIKIIDLINEGAKKIYGEGFNEKHQKEYEHIKHMFECRNKIAHRGTPTFMSNKGVCVVTLDIADEWWVAVGRLIEWVSSNLNMLKKRTLIE
ncbi:MAG: hypothetical protein ACHQQQ_07230 [Bacteroidota bacterium]